MPDPTIIPARRRPLSKVNRAARTILHGNPNVSNVSIWKANGVRPRYNVAGTKVIYDYLGTDNFYDVAVCDADGSNVVEMTSGRSGMPQRHNGNGKFHPGGSFVVFQGEAAVHEGSTTGNPLSSISNPGLGFHCDLYASNLAGTSLWNLTNLDHRQDGDPSPLLGGRTVKQFVNPVFNPSGTLLVWSDTYLAEPSPPTPVNYTTWGKPQPSAWGIWRLRCADWSAPAGVPTISNVRDLYYPPYGPSQVTLGAPYTGGNYVTPMEFFRREQPARCRESERSARVFHDAIQAQSGDESRRRYEDR
jgi:hypothetical protein